MRKMRIGESHYRLVRAKNGLRIEKIDHPIGKGGASNGRMD